jgi:hypothetical protein
MFSSKLMRTVIAGTLLLTAFRIQSARADAGKAITYDTPVDGQITDAAPEEDWTFAAPGKDRIQIVVDRSGGTLVPEVELRDSNNQRIGGASADESYASAETSVIELANAGNYTVAVTRYSGKDGKTTGNYKLTVKLLSSGATGPADTQPIAYDKPATGEITTAKWNQIWEFNSTAKDYVTIAVQRTDGSLVPRVNLLDSSGNKLTGGSLDDSYASSTIDHFQLPNAGKYQVQVVRDNDFNGDTTGKYSVTVSLDGTGSENTALFQPVKTAAYDQSYNGELTNAKWVDVYPFDAKAKDHVKFKVTRVDGTLFPALMLMGANQQEITRANEDTTGTTSTLDTTLPGPGHYELRVQRYDDAGGKTAGKYALDVILLGAGADDPALQASAGEVKLDTPSKGNLTNAKWRDTWTFNAADKGPFTLTVKRTGGTLVPRVNILGANKQDINTGFPDSTYAVATIENFTLPGPGQYTIVISRDGDTGGGTTGAYELSISAAKQ